MTTAARAANIESMSVLGAHPARYPVATSGQQPAPRMAIALGSRSWAWPITPFSGSLGAQKPAVPVPFVPPPSTPRGGSAMTRPRGRGPAKRKLRLTEDHRIFVMAFIDACLSAALAGMLLVSIRTPRERGVQVVGRPLAS